MREVRKIAETIRRELKLYVGHGGSEASFLPRVKRAYRHLRRRRLEKALTVLASLDRDLRERI